MIIAYFYRCHKRLNRLATEALVWYTEINERRTAMKKLWIVILIVTLVPALLFGGCVYLFTAEKNDIYTDISQYDQDIQQICNAAKFMPDLDTLTGYQEIKYLYKVKHFAPILGFRSDGFALFVTYDDSQYEAKKLEALDSYEFLQEPVMRNSDTYELPLTEFTYRDYTMKVVPDGEYIDFCACKSFLMLGFNDEKHTIAYLYFYDFDVDLIASVGEDLEEEMGSFIEFNFAWPE